MANNFQTIKYTVAAGIWFAGLLVASFLPASAIDQEFHLFDGEDKVLHLIMYSGLSFLTITAFSKEKVLIISKTTTILMVISVAVLTEWIQSYIPGRSMSGWDMLANIGGVVVGLGIVRVVRH